VGSLSLPSDPAVEELDAYLWAHSKGVLLFWSFLSGLYCLPLIWFETGWPLFFALYRQLLPVFAGACSMACEYSASKFSSTLLDGIYVHIYENLLTLPTAFWTFLRSAEQSSMSFPGMLNSVLCARMLKLVYSLDKMAHAHVRACATNLTCIAVFAPCTGDAWSENWGYILWKD